MSCFRPDPECINRTVDCSSALTWYIEYIYDWRLHFPKMSFLKTDINLHQAHVTLLDFGMSE